MDLRLKLGKINADIQMNPTQINEDSIYRAMVQKLPVEK
jgi:hypothetical protein